jgi:hypothetical protein
MNHRDVNPTNIKVSVGLTCPNANPVHPGGLLKFRGDPAELSSSQDWAKILKKVVTYLRIELSESGSGLNQRANPPILMHDWIATVNWHICAYLLPTTQASHGKWRENKYPLDSRDGFRLLRWQRKVSIGISINWKEGFGAIRDATIA